LYLTFQLLPTILGNFISLRVFQIPYFCRLLFRCLPSGAQRVILSLGYAFVILPSTALYWCACVGEGVSFLCGCEPVEPAQLVNRSDRRMQPPANNRNYYTSCTLAPGRGKLFNTIFIQLFSSHSLEMHDIHVFELCKLRL